MDPMSKFSVDMSAALRGIMREYGVTGAQVAEHLGKSTGFVSERTNGKDRAPTTDVIAAVARLAGLTDSQMLIVLAQHLQTKARRDVTQTAVLRSGGKKHPKGDDSAKTSHGEEQSA